MARLFARMALDFPDHPKILPLSDAAFRCYVEAVLWSRKQQTDGLLPKRLAVAKWSLDVLRELSTNDPENPSLIEAEEGWYIHDFASEQDTKAVIEARRQHAIDAGRKGGLARAKRTAKQGAKQTAKQTAKQNSSIDRDIDREEITTYVDREYHVSSAREPANFDDPRGAGISATPAADLVRAIVPKGHPPATLTSLRLQASELLKTGTDSDVVADALRLWCDKPGVGNGRTILASLCSEVIKSRAAPNASTSGKPHKLRALADLAAEVRAAEVLEMETANRKAIQA